jgi:predicted nucleic acid-binding protein
VEAEVFLDTSYAIALSAVTDQHHARAIALADEMQRLGTRLITTQAILLEIGNALAKQRYRAAAVRLLLSLEADPNVDIVALSSDLYARGRQLFAERTDKDWGLIDCLSFVVMSERGLREALTADEHFRQAGFRMLLGA